MTTVSISPKSATIQYGKNSTFTAAVADAPEDASITYAWKVDTVDVSETTNSITVQGDKAGSKTIEVTVTVEVPESEPEIITDTATLEVTKINQNTTVSVSSSKPQVLTNEPVTITATVSSAPAGASIEYKWFKNNIEAPGETGNSITAQSPTATTLKFKCEVHVNAENYNTFSGTTPDHSVPVINRSLTATATIEPVEASINTGDSIEIEVLTDNPESADVDYVWSTGDTTQKISFPGSSSGKYEVSCIVTFTKTGYDTLKSPKLVSNISVAIDENGIKYIHPLESRNSAYLWSGWWVMDELQRAVKEGIDWKNPHADVKYKEDMKTLAFIVDNYPNIEVQESRNGYILDKQRIENGDIYK